MAKKQIVKPTTELEAESTPIVKTEGLTKIEEFITFLKPDFTYDDRGMAQRFNHASDGKLVQIEEERDQWASWNGLRWEVDSPTAVARTIVLTEQSLGGHYIDGEMQGEIAGLYGFKGEYLKQQRLSHIFPTTAEKKVDPILHKIDGLIRGNERMKAYTRSEKGNTALMRQVSRLGALKKSITEFDSKGRFIGVKNGVVNLETCELIVGKPEYLITKSVNAEFNLAAQCPQWEKTIMHIAGGDTEIAAFLQRLAGSMLLEEKKDKFIVIHSAKGGYGKSTFSDMILFILGEYGQHVSSEMIIGHGSDKPYYIASLRGKRAIVMNETDVDAYLAGALVKQLVDSGPLQARNPAGRPFTIDPKFTSLLSTNTIPDMGSDEALWRRMLIVEFKNMIQEALRNPNFRRDVLELEADGILAWMVKGCLMYQIEGFKPPADIVAATKAEKSAQDKVEQFNMEFCETTHNEFDSVSLTVWRKYYEVWCKEQGLKPESGKRLVKMFRAKGYVVERQAANVLTIFGLKFEVEPISREHENNFGSIVLSETTLNDMRKQLQKLHTNDDVDILKTRSIRVIKR
jgi:P4 family phage/plasmid primase-like protien